MEIDAIIWKSILIKGIEYYDINMYVYFGKTQKHKSS